MSKFNQFSDLAFIKGQEYAKRMVEVAIANNHNIIFMGCQSTGKTVFLSACLSMNLNIKIYDDIDKLRLNQIKNIEKDIINNPDSMFALSASYCPCGYWTDKTRECSCSPAQIRKYESRFKHLFKHMDIICNLTAPTTRDLLNGFKGESSEDVMKRIDVAKTITLESEKLDESSKTLIECAMNKLGLSTGQYFNVLALSKTIARLDQAFIVKAHHVGEAIQYQMDTTL